MNVDSLSRIMEFSKVKERRNLSCVSCLFKETFEKTKEECTRLAMGKLVEERRERFEFPIVTSKHQTIRECLPKGYRRYHILRHLEKRAMKIIQYELFYLDFDDMISTIRENKSYEFFMKLSTLFFFRDKDTRMTLETLYANFSPDGEKLYHIDDFIKNKHPLWKHMDGIEETCDNQNRDDTLEFYVALLYDCFEWV